MPASSTALFCCDHHGSFRFFQSESRGQWRLGRSPAGHRVVARCSSVHRRFICAPIYWRHGRLGGPRSRVWPWRPHCGSH